MSGKHIRINVQQGQDASNPSNLLVRMVSGCAHSVLLVCLVSLRGNVFVLAQGNGPKITLAAFVTVV